MIAPSVAAPTSLGGPPAVPPLSDRTAAPAEPTPSAVAASERSAVAARLGAASCLFAALQARHAPAATHSLRVAMTCSSWGLVLGMPEAVLEQLELAAVTHDVGLIGVPERLLARWPDLTGAEAATVERHRVAGAEMLVGCRPPQAVLDAVRTCGLPCGGPDAGSPTPLGRMIAIVDAYDRLTAAGADLGTAFADLAAGMGTRFDPAMVEDFAGLMTGSLDGVADRAARRWVGGLGVGPTTLGLGFRAKPPVESFPPGLDAAVDVATLLSTMLDAAVLVDEAGIIRVWNDAAETLTGLNAEALCGTPWTPAALSLHARADRPMTAAECPVARVLATGEALTARWQMPGPDDVLRTFEAHLSPVPADAGLGGALVLLRDISDSVDLEERVETLHQRATRDALTGTLNRAEFMRRFEEELSAHQADGRSCALLIGDLDFFKRVNDTYGHQAGDEAIIAFARLIRQHARESDLIGRYGGEEFMILCPGCDLAGGAVRAETIRGDLETIPQPFLGGKVLRTSFGVTECGSGDTPETMFKRADAALLQAKEMGRNLVVELPPPAATPGGGLPSTLRPARLAWLFGRTPELIIRRTLVSVAPRSVIVEKLRGFITERAATLVACEMDRVVLTAMSSDPARRTTDRPVAFRLELTLSACSPTRTDLPEDCRTVIDVQLTPVRTRDRRRNNIVAQARTLIREIRQYLVAQEHGDPAIEGAEVVDGLWQHVTARVSRLLGSRRDERYGKA